MRIRDLSRALAYVLLCVGIGTLAYESAVLVTVSVYQFNEQRELSHALQARAVRKANAVVVPSSAKSKPNGPTPGAIIGSLAIPRLGLATIVVEGDGDRELKLAAGHIPGTSLPGQRGNVGIAAHRDTFFRPLRRIRENDAITVTTLSGEFRYRVASTAIVNPDNVRVLFPSKTETLTLVTCYPFNFVGPAPRRFIVRAKRLSVNP